MKPDATCGSCEHFRIDDYDADGRPEDIKGKCYALPPTAFAVGVTRPKIQNAPGSALDEIECVAGVPPTSLRLIKDIVKKRIYYAVRDAGRIPPLPDDESDQD